MSDVRIVDNTDRVKNMSEKNIEICLEKIGLMSEAYAKDMCPVDTGRLRASITHETGEDSVIIGTNVEYAGYVELGTSKQDPQPYLVPSLQNHISEIERIIRLQFGKE